MNLMVIWRARLAPLSSTSSYRMRDHSRYTERLALRLCQDVGRAFWLLFENWIISINIQLIRTQFFFNVCIG